MFFFYNDISFCYGEHYRHIKIFKPDYSRLPMTELNDLWTAQAIVTWLSYDGIHIVGFDDTDNSESPMICYCFYDEERDGYSSETTVSRALDLEHEHNKANSRKKISYIYE